MQYEIRELKTEEIPLLEDFLYEAIFIPDGMEKPPREIIKQPELQVYVRDFGCEKDDHALVAESDGKVIGVVWVRIMDDYGHIDDNTPSLAISVLEGYRGKGIGTALMKKMIEHLGSNGYSGVSLSVQKANYAVKMYRHLGFKVISEDDEEFIMAHRLKKNYVYILKCADGTYYTGWTTDPEKRVRVHNSGKGAKYTRPRRPVELIYTEEYWNKTDAQSREYAIKQLTRAEKEELIRMDARDYEKQAKELWGETPAYKEYEEKAKGRTADDQNRIAADMMGIFCEFGKIKKKPADSDEAQKLVRKLQDFITEHYYTCTDEILAGLGEAYGSGGEFTKNINAAAGNGTAEYAADAIKTYCLAERR